MISREIKIKAFKWLSILSFLASLTLLYWAIFIQTEDTIKMLQVFLRPVPFGVAYLLFILGVILGGMNPRR